ncbi:hypothetical protein PENPOL_c024G08265 [Penicillium polonicum]|uniref:Uncharacterized protein n=1 Tax=Penicillium polonicum TaxID=60169 RepID=A0A1V6N6J7_PENPO|nr:hypothetical protein PENPOL_c024G08265 [Penicillium polonicum]
MPTPNTLTAPIRLSRRSMTACFVVPRNTVILTTPSLEELQATLEQSNNSCPPLARPTPGFSSSMTSTITPSRDSNRKISSEVIERQLPVRIPSQSYSPTASCLQTTLAKEAYRHSTWGGLNIDFTPDDKDGWQWYPYDLIWELDPQRSPHRVD